MPLVSAHTSNPAIDGRQSETAMKVRSGVIRGLKESGLVFLPEFTLTTGRRADLVGLDQKGMIIIFEIKSSIADFNADSKWHEYKDFCDRFYFATHPDVPLEIFPISEGMIVADEHGCEIIREAEETKLPAPTRKALTLRFARAAANRIRRFALHETGPGQNISEDILVPSDIQDEEC